MVLDPTVELEGLNRLLSYAAGGLSFIAVSGWVGFFLGQRAARGTTKTIRTLCGFGGLWIGGAVAQIVLMAMFVTIQLAAMWA